MTQLPVQPAHRLLDRPEQQRWLVTDLWSEEAVGIIGGEPKCCKSFLALDLAVSVAAGTPCLRRFAVPRPGRVLLYAAEDALHIVRRRLEGICAAAGLRLAGQRDVAVGVCSRPQANLADFYREMGDLFGVELRPHNRWAGAKVLRQRWQTHIDASLSRPMLIVDEAQEMLSTVLSELRLLCSTRLDSHILLTVVLAGDGRLVERLRSDEFLPLGSPMRVRLALERATPDELEQYLRHALQKAGAVKLMTPELIATLCDHAQGNLRALMNMAGELLAFAAEREARQIDEKLFLEICAPQPAETKAAGGRRR